MRSSSSQTGEGDGDGEGDDDDDDGGAKKKAVKRRKGRATCREAQSDTELSDGYDDEGNPGTTATGSKPLPLLGEVIGISYLVAYRSGAQQIRDLDDYPPGGISGDPNAKRAVQGPSSERRGSPSASTES